MSRFIQLHFLTAYPPANLNRDEMGRPKTAMFGGTQRLRVSSQSLKRAWRTSDVFSKGLEGHKGERTKDLGNDLYDKLLEGLGEKGADEAARAIAGQYGSLKTAKKGDPNAAKIGRQHDTLTFYSPDELRALDALALELVKAKVQPTKEQLQVFPMAGKGAADISLFGRMLAADPGKNIEAAAQVAHALSVHRVTVEDDFFTAVDDRNKHEEDAGAGHMGNTEFAAGLFYEYVCIDRALLLKNLDGNAKLTADTLRALGEACLTVSPSGKKNSFGSMARASYALAEKGDQQPRSLAVSFLEAIEDKNHLKAAIASLRTTRDNLDRAYGQCWSSEYAMDASGSAGTMQGLLDFLAQG